MLWWERSVTAHEDVHRRFDFIVLLDAIHQRHASGVRPHETTSNGRSTTTGFSEERGRWRRCQALKHRVRRYVYVAPGKPCQQRYRLCRVGARRHRGAAEAGQRGRGRECGAELVQDCTPHRRRDVRAREILLFLRRVTGQIRPTPLRTIIADHRLH